VDLVIFKQKRKALFVFFAGAGALALFSVLKLIFARPRPLYPLLSPEHGFSFPSGHATFSFVFYGALAYLAWLTNFPKYIKMLMMGFLVGLSLLIGISRIYLRVHYPSDVLAGFCLGYSWLFLLIFIFRKWFPLYRNLI
jgi:undecaprenyl-diphosphatase